MSAPVRMLVVSSDNHPPTRVDVAVLFGEELAQRGHRVDWILQSEAPCARAHVVEWGGGRVWVGATDTGTSLAASLRKHWRGVRNDLRLFGLLRRGDYQIIEVKDKFLSGLMAMLAARLYRRRFVYWLSFPFPEDYLQRARDGTGRYPFLYRVRGTVFKWLLYGVLLRAADHVFVQSDEMRRQLGLQGVPLAKMTAVPMGIRAADATPPAAALATRVLPANVPSILYLGSLGRLRHLEVLIGALAGVLEQVPEAKLYFVGKGDLPGDEEFLVAEAQRRGVSHAIVWIGQKPRAEALAHVRDADVCVSPIFPTPVYDVASPTKIVEYMAMQKAVVANDHPDQRFLLDESGGGLAVPWDETAFARAIVQLLQDPARRAAMGERGRRYALEHRTYGVIADQVERELVRLAATVPAP